MKKLLSVLLVAMLVMSLCVTSFAAPTIDYIFRGNENGTSGEAEYVYLFGKTTDEVEDLGVEITGPEFGTKNISFSANGTPDQLDELNLQAAFGFAIDNSTGKVGNTLMFKPYQVVGGETTYGELKYAKGITADTAVTPDKPGTYLASNAVTATPKTSYSIKEMVVRDDQATTVNENMPGVFYAQAYSAASVNSRATRNFVMQFPLTDEMLNATNIYLSLGCNNVYSGSHTSLTANGAEFSIWEATNLDNDWSYAANANVSEMLNSGSTVEKSLISTYNVTDNGVYTAEGTNSGSHSDGYILKLGGAEFTSFIKNKINAGEKLVNLVFAISDLDAVEYQNLLVLGTSRIHLNGNYSGGRSYLEKYLSAIRWE